MNNKTSTNLDLLRWIAAFTVFAFHFLWLGYTGIPREEIFHRYQMFGPLGVGIFFVLSGYVIAYVVETKHSDWRDYLRARFSRLYSVYIPAILLTFIVDAIGRHWNAEIYEQFPAPFNIKTGARFIISILFLQENSFFSSRWLSDSPMWSLAYEFWYYILFGVAVYFRGRIRVAMMLVALFLAGWKILLLFPVWLAGVSIYHFRDRILRISSGWRLAIFCASLCLLVLLCTPGFFYTLQPVWALGTKIGPFGFHSLFPFYYVALPALAGIVASCIQKDSGASVEKSQIAVFIRWGAGSSFSLYLFHVPLILFVRSSGIYDSKNIGQVLLAAIAVFSMAYFLALFSEHRKKWWSVQIARFL